MIEKEIRKVDKDVNGLIITIPYNKIFINSARFMASSLSNLVNNLADVIHKINCKDCHCFLDNKSVDENITKYKYLSCNKKLFK